MPILLGLEFLSREIRVSVSQALPRHFNLGLQFQIGYAEAVHSSLKTRTQKKS